MNDSNKIKFKDARSLSSEAQEELRKKTVRTVLDGMTQINASKIFGITRQTIGKWIKAYRESGVDGLKSQKRGHPFGGALQPEKEQQIVDMIIHHTPDQLDLSYALWTRRAVADLIHKQFGIRYSLQTVGRYLKRWGFTPQKPVRRAYEQNPQSITRWLKQEYPKIKQKARAEDAEIFWGDEMGIRSDHANGTTYGRKGQTPVIPGPGKRFGCNLIVGINNHGTLNFMVFLETFVTGVFLDFLKRLIRQNNRKIFLIVDGHPVHRSQKVKEWLTQHTDRISLYFLPGYSPELNPAEYLIQDVKSNASKKRRPHNLTELLANVRSYLHSRQRKPKVVANYFMEKHISYAAV